MGSGVLMMIDSQAKIRDIKKNKMFLENEEKLNKRIQVNRNILKGMNKKTIQTLEEDLKLRKVFTLNMIDKMSYYDLKQLLINIEREEELGVENFTIEEDKPKEYTKK